MSTIVMLFNMQRMVAVLMLLSVLWPAAVQGQEAVLLPPGTLGQRTMEPSVMHVTVDDNARGLRLTKSELTLLEGGGVRGQIGIELTEKPTGAVRVDVGASGVPNVNEVISVGGSFTGPAYFIFGLNDWDSPKLMWVQAKDDMNAINETLTIHLDPSGGGYNSVETVLVPIYVIDDDAMPGLVVDPDPLSVNEGSSDTYTVALATQPTAEVTVVITGHSGTDLTLDQASLTFTTADWNRVKTVTVSAAADADFDDDMATLTHTASSADSDYDDATAEVVVNVDDNTRGVRVTPSVQDVNEGGMREYFRVELTEKPTGSRVRVDVRFEGVPNVNEVISAGGNFDGSTFFDFPLSDWDRTKLMWVEAKDDMNASNETITVHFDPRRGGYNSAKTTVVTINVVDDDMAEIVLSATTLGVDEGDDESYTVKLATQPTAAVTVAITGQSGTDLTLDKTSLTFNPSGSDLWSTAQTVTVTAGEDDDATNDTATLVHTASGGDYAGETASLTVNTTDNETVGIMLSVSALGVDEGDDESYTVKLLTQPTAEVTVAITGHSGTDLTLDQTSLTFTTGNWNVAQTVTVTAGEDDDATNDTATLVHTASGGDYAGETASLTVNTTDNETVGIMLSVSALGVDEGDDESYTVKLLTQPTAEVTVAITGHSGTDLTLDQTSLTFTTGNWNVAKTVTVTAGEDDDATNDTATLLHTASGGDYAGETASLTVNTTDNETVEIVLSASVLAVNEGADKTYTVKLATQPTGAVTVAITGLSGTDLTLDKTSLTFNPSGSDLWSTAQMVTVSAGPDDDATNDRATLVHTASGGDYAGQTASLTVNTTDDDTAEIVLSATTLGVNEGADKTYTVKLATQPTAAVTVAITGHSGTDLTLDKTSLTFNPSGSDLWSTAQTVTVSAGEDDDATNDTATLLHTASGGDYAGETASLTVNTTDNETAQILLSASTLGVNEGGDKTYTVKLAAQPTAAVTVAITGLSGTDLTLDKTSLTFNPSGSDLWSDAQMVTVSAGEDGDATNDTATLLHTASGGDYAGKTASLMVNTTDDDTAEIVLSASTLAVNEGADKTYTVKLATQPTAAVTVAITGHSGTDLTLDKSSLTFNPSGSDLWSTAQTVTVTAGEDDDATNDTATLLHTASGGDFAGQTASLTVNTTDNETVGIMLSVSALGVDEGDDEFYTVKLATQPTAAVTVAITGQSGTDLTLDKTSLTFNPSGSDLWSTAQTVTVTAGEDDDATNDTATLVHTASGGDYAGETASLTVNTTDNETVGIMLSVSALGVNEGDDESYTVKLLTQPTAEVTVAITGHSGTDLTLDQTSLTFTTGNWNVAQTVTVTAGEDDDATNDTATLVHTASGGDYAGETASLTVNTTDNETVGIMLSVSALGVNEGSNNTYTVKLLTQPTAEVTVAITGHSGTDLTLDQTSLTFTTGNWNVAQPVMVSAGEDDDATNDSATLVHTASGGDYAGETASLTVNTTDNETVEIVLSASVLAVNEGADKTYTVKLATQPTGAVTVAITGLSGTDLTLDKTSLTFNPSGSDLWSTAQMVTVSAGPDADATNDRATLVHTASGGDYAGQTQSLAVTVDDDDTVEIVLSASVLAVNEGGNNTYTVKLATQPSAAVTVAITGHSGTDLTLDKTSLTFNPSGSDLWSTAQTVTVSAGLDYDATNDRATLLHTASGGGYAGQTKSLAVTVDDDDTVEIVLSASALGVNEGGDNTYTVKLATEPTAAVTVAITGHSGTDLTLDKTSLTFNPSGSDLWSTAQTVTVSAGLDYDATNDRATLLHTASGGGYAGQTKSLAVTVDDDDTVEIVLSASALGVNEGGDNTYTVKLATEPTAAVTVAITGHSGTDLTLDKTSLTFNPSGSDLWSTAQTVMMSAGEDGDATNDRATLLHTASGGGYAGQTKSLAVTVDDDDTVEIVLSASALGVNEGGDNTYTVRLATEPTAAVTVAITGHSGTDLTLDKTSLTFNPSGSDLWSTAQTVTMSAGQDDDATNDRATLLHTASGGGYAGQTKSLAVTVDDDDTVEIVLSASALGVNEGGDNTYTVRLATEPTAAVTVAITGLSGTDLTLDKTSLTFNPSGSDLWSTAQTVTVSAGEDIDATNDSATLTHTASGGDYAGETGSLTVTTTDDETAEIVALVALAVTEGASASFDVELSAAPLTDVTVTISGHSGTDLTLDVTSLTFTSINWSTAQPVMVTAAEDDDLTNDPVMLTLSAAGGEFDGETHALTVTAIDNDVPSLVAPEALAVTEGMSASFDVELSAAPTGPVTVTVPAFANTDLSRDPGTLTFTTANWSDAQTVTVTAGHDSDFADDSATLTLTAAGGGYDGVTHNLAVMVDDDETAELAAPSELSVPEGGSASFAVALSVAPTGTVMVTVPAFANTDLSRDMGTLTFTPTNWNDAQMVTVTADQDSDFADDSETLTLSAAGGGYDGVTHRLAVTVDDDETAELEAPSVLTVPEGVSRFFNVALSVAPTDTVTVTITGHAGTDLTLDRTSLTFTTTNWRDAQILRVTAAEDEDSENDLVTLTLVSSGGGYDDVSHDLAVTVDDDESRELEAPVVLAVTEGASASFTVALSAAPTGMVTVTISGHAGSDLTLDRISLTYTTTNWSDAQAVTVTAAKDEDFINDEEMLTLEASGGGFDDVTHDLVVTVDDNETAELVAPVALAVTEGASASFTVALSAAPTDTARVAITGHAGTDLTLDRTLLTFTTVNWNTEQMVEVTAAEDDDLTNDQDKLMLTAAGGGYAGVTHDLVVTATDNDVPGLVTPAALEVQEGSSESFTVALSAAPMGTVTVTVPTFLNADLSRDPGTLTFTTANWSDAQAVVVKAAEDDDSANDPETLTLTASGGGFEGVTHELDVTAIDNDVPGLVAPAALALMEGASASFAIALTVAPTTDVTVTIFGHAGSDLTLDRELLTFTTANWREAQTVTVTADQDSDFTDDEETLTLLASGGGYAGVMENLDITVDDDDDAALVVLPPTLSVDEGEVAVFTAALSDAPLADVTVTITGHAGSDLTLDRELLTFTTTNWSDAQTVTVIAAEDDDFINDQETLTLSASGGGFAGEMHVLSVTVEDNDVPDLLVAPVELAVTEGASASFTVALSDVPLADVTVTIAGHAGSDLELDVASLTFTITNWSDAQTVTVTAAEDDDFENDPPVTLMLSAAGGGYDGVAQDILVTVDDNDEAALVVQPLALSVDEGGTAAFTAALSAAPSTDVTVTITGHAGSDLSLDKSSLMFTTTNWNAAQTVMVTAAEDDDTADDHTTLTLAASGGGYDGVTRELPVTVTDAGERPLTVSVEDAEAVEGTQMLRMRVVLNRPADQVVGVNYATSDQTAEQSSDYMSARGIMVFDRGAIHGVLSVELKDDDLAEGNEVFEVTLTNASEGLTIGRSVGEGVILDDDGVPLLRIDDVAVSEEEEVVRFTLRLSEPSARTVTVRYRTEDGSAQAGMDYVAAAGMVQFKPGRTEAVLEVELMQDGMDWREETFTVHLEAPEHARLEKAVATATVRDETSVAAGVMAAYASRFVRTSAIHVVEALESRMRSGVGGSDCSAGLRREESLLWHPQSSWNPSLGQLLSGCRVAAHAETPRGVFSAWGRASYTQFHGRTDDALTLRGQVSSGLAGADYRWHHGWMAGLLLAHSYGEGTFEVHQEAGDIRAGLTGVYPYLAYHRPAQTYWLTGGFGRGTSEVLTLEGDLTSRFGATGLQGDLWSGRRLRLKYLGDLLFANAKITEHNISVRTHRVRAGMEGSLRVGGTLRPYGEVYVRRDGGSAETGTGLEVGGGVSWAYPAYRLKADVRSRRLVLHTADGFSEWGFSGALVYGGHTSGLTLALRPMWGSAAGGLLYRQPVLQERLAGGLRRTALEAGYGIPWGTRTVRSLLGVTAFDKGAMYRLGSELVTQSAFGVSVSAQVHAPPHAPPALGIQLQSRFRY